MSAADGPGAAGEAAAPGGGAGPVVDVQVAPELEADGEEGPPPDRVRRWAAAALAGRGPAELTVRLVGEAEMARLNAVYRGRSGPTDVLAFPAEPGLPVDPPLLGDVVLCVPVARRAAAELGRDPAYHLAHLVVHGVLHLLGHDHHAPEEARRMAAAEAEALGRLGWPDPRGAGGRDGGGEAAGEGAS